MFTDTFLPFLKMAWNIVTAFVLSTSQQFGQDSQQESNFARILWTS